HVDRLRRPPRRRPYYVLPEMAITIAFTLPATTTTFGLTESSPISQTRMSGIQSLRLPHSLNLSTLWHVSTNGPSICINISGSEIVSKLFGSLSPTLTLREERK